MGKFLVIYSTTDGHTREICERLEDIIARHGHAVTLKDIGDLQDAEPEHFDKIVIGASIRYGRHSKAVYRFITDHAQLLADKPSAFFSVNLVARKPTKRQADTNPYVRKFLRQIPWQPKELTIFAGKLDYPRYRFWDRQIIRLIMWMTKGPTDPTTIMDFTDWSQVEAFGDSLSKLESG
jgi:menaquinone-dependent protoporphyrinogen oxidase